MHDEFDIGIAAEGEGLAAIAEDCAEDLRILGTNVLVETRSLSIKASVEWLVPTAVALFITQKYLGTLLEEAAKDHYPKVKAAFARLARRTTGRHREVRLAVLAVGKTVESDPAALSFWVALRDGRRAAFRFDHDLAGDDLAVACDDLLGLLVAHARNDANDTLGRLPSAVPSSPWAPIILRFDAKEGRWRCWVLDRGEAILHQDQTA